MVTMFTHFVAFDVDGENQYTFDESINKGFLWGLFEGILQYFVLMRSCKWDKDMVQ